MTHVDDPSRVPVGSRAMKSRDCDMWCTCRKCWSTDADCEVRS